jgi:deoxyribonuclease IV
MRKFGFHLSIAGSLSNAPNEAKSKGYGAFQMFVSTSRSWKGRKIGGDEAELFRKSVADSKSTPFAHIPYLCNPASPEDEVISKSKIMMEENVNSCDLLGIKGLVIHVGSHKGKGIEFGMKRVAETVSEVLQRTKGTTVLLENGAGYNNSVGSHFDEIGKIIDTIGSDRVGLCLDTCHAFAAGYDMTTEQGIEKLVGEIDDNVGLKKMHLVHLNDSKFGISSGLDRHWHIGKGEIGSEGFVNFFRNKAFASGDFVMETPVDESGDEDSDMAALKKILEAARL